MSHPQKPSAPKNAAEVNSAVSWAHRRIVLYSPLELTIV